MHVYFTEYCTSHYIQHELAEVQCETNKGNGVTTGVYVCAGLYKYKGFVEMYLMSHLRLLHISIRVCLF